MEAVMETERRPKMYAALQTAPEQAYVPQPRDIDIEVRVNIHGELMLLHDQPFDAIPLWIRYKNAARQLEILFEDGYCWPLENQISDTLHMYIIRSAKVNIIRLESNNVVEGWETILLNDTYQ